MVIRAQHEKADFFIIIIKKKNLQEDSFRGKLYLPALLLLLLYYH